MRQVNRISPNINKIGKMILKELLKAIQPVQIAGDPNIEITGINIDSRRVEDGHLFMAMRGTQTDGHAYIAAAIAKGAVAILCEEIPESRKEGVTYVQVKNSEDATGKLATCFYGDPTSKIELVGVTGTNGKTTIATLLYNTFRYFGYKVGLLSTVCNYIDDEAIPTEHTTPDPITLNRLLGRMADEGCKYVFMEVSSHAIAQKRISGLKFAGGIFTNLTRDHLDYHKTVENYLKAKKKFFDDMPKDAFSLVNLDDRNGLVMTQNTRSKVYTYSLRSLSDFKGRVLESHFEGMLLDFNNKEIAVRFIGKFNASNLLAVFGAAVLLGKKEEEVLVALSTLHPVSGRFEAIRSPQGFTAIVDYAHTPDALANVLNAIHGVLEGKGKVITVIGAGGNRDKGKRPIMAKEAVRNSDRVIITSDNPRFEDPQEIINDMLAGLDTEDRKKTISIVDRKEAIRTACMLVEKGDVVLVAGKGHENYQEIKGVKHHFDDKEILISCFNG
ncbi:UDP-N-acetylmuramoyl-L-alanyl-D-glutamate--2,6-diaminopimelate ligase [Bacteroides pyogenes F0041]|uniref:UDP-N-acetylmuramoyl-L-alanyl-D-glutamate--2,6-diaminopimelate ligase n=3 Tax=Bacteroides pyogenes TaxID=310300 RepID=U2C8E0_9BACE|nr:UDP-N-acetylmuramoyl-L-alanyl-D-glutamate--2,6-diaminopimelate ligase [Bacteroides pyogenes F0041]GAE22210.1 glycosyl transferase [Bacteroides pyogenes JCM 10003]SUV32613.1 UDP-N-acetylmuramoylalanyl-D-glutamate--2, 6-diaminopimela te ligase [Bacteroides pyogenes]